MAETVGILAPMAVEMAPLWREFRVTDTKAAAGLKMSRGWLRDSQVVLTIAGVGKVNGAAAAQALIDHWGLSALILTGVAGTLVPEAAPGDVVIATSHIQFDVGVVRPNHYTPMPIAVRQKEGNVSRMRAVASSGRFTRLAMERARAVDFPYQRGRRPRVIEGAVATGDSLILWPEALARLALELHVVAIDMEGAAVAQVAQANGVEMVAVRGISDVAADLAKIELENVAGLGAAGSLKDRAAGVAGAARFVASRPANVIELLRLARAMRGAARNAAAVVAELVASLE